MKFTRYHANYLALSTVLFHSRRGMEQEVVHLAKSTSK